MIEFNIVNFGEYFKDGGEMILPTISIPFSLRRKHPFRTLRTHGAVAQLGERLVRNEEVVGSIPISSTQH